MKANNQEENIEHKVTLEWAKYFATSEMKSSSGHVVNVAILKKKVALRRRVHPSFLPGWLYQETKVTLLN
jgi:hypothetical protein